MPKFNQCSKKLEQDLTSATIKQVTMEEAREIDQERLPIGKFYVRKENKYIAIDNSTGDADIRHFEDYDSCIKWLDKSSIRVDDDGMITITISIKELMIFNHAVDYYRKRKGASEKCRSAENKLLKKTMKWIEYWHLFRRK